MPKRRSGSILNLKPFLRAFFTLTRSAVRFAPMISTVAIVWFFVLGVRHTLHADPYFRVERIRVFPSGILTEAEHQFLETKIQGKSLAELDLKQISRSLERNPKVVRAQTIRELPRELRIMLVTRTPFIQVQFGSTGPYYLVGSDQVILSRQDSPNPEVMVLEDLSAKQTKYSVGTLYQNKYFDELNEVFDLIRTDPALQDETILKLSMDQLGNVTLILKDGIELKIGKQFALSEKMRLALNTFLSSTERANIVYLDIRYHDVIVRKKSS